MLGVERETWSERGPSPPKTASPANGQIGHTLPLVTSSCIAVTASVAAEEPVHRMGPLIEYGQAQGPPRWDSGCGTLWSSLPGKFDAMGVVVPFFKNVLFCSVCILSQKPFDLVTFPSIFRLGINL
jgi:hypothetical protein